MIPNRWYAIYESSKLKTDKPVKVVLELDGETLQPLEELTQTAKIDAGGEARVDWRVKVLDEGHRPPTRAG